MPKPTSAKYRGRVDGELLDVTMLEIDCPLVGMEVLVSKDGHVWINVDGVCVLRVKNGAMLRVEDTRTGYIHEAATD